MNPTELIMKIMKMLFSNILRSALMWTCILSLGPSAFAEHRAPETVLKATKNPFDVDKIREGLRHEGFTQWKWLESNCDNCELAIVLTDPRIQKPRVSRFVSTLAHAKQDLMEIYSVDGGEYNLLAHMAVGILGRESEFFESRRYRIKENLQSAVTLAKVMENFFAGEEITASPNSRGPTQIKVVPEKIAETYGVTPRTLYIPENAALATMGFLIEALQELKRRAHNNGLEHINETTYVDYLPYIYFGATRALIKRTATPEKNIYVHDMKYYMTWVELYERATPVGSFHSWYHGAPVVHRAIKK